jgi:predicted Zn-dependent peptidase
MPLDLRDFPVHESALGNGLKIRLLPDHRLPLCTLYSFFRVGSRNERPGITGISHLFEHMMFNGSRNFGPKEFDRRLEAAGGTSNAYTSNDLTAYYEDFAAEALPLVLDLESDRMASLTIDDRSLARERGVVKEERRYRTDNDLDGMMDEALSAQAFLAHPYRWPVVGWMSDLNRISRADCEAYFRTYYAPNNCTLWLAGDFDPEQALAAIGQRYGAIPAGPPLPEVAAGEPPQKGERRSQVQFPAQAPALLVGFRTPPGDHADSLALDLIESALGHGEGGLLRRALVHDQQLCLDVRAGFGWRLDPGLFQVALRLNQGVDPAVAEKALWAELERLRSEGLTEAEATRARNLVRAGLLRTMASSNGKAHFLGQIELMLGDWRRALQLEERYAAVGRDDLRRVASQVFAPHRRNIVLLVPGDQPEPDPADLEPAIDAHLLDESGEAA